jgi:hypothetical protein
MGIDGRWSSQNFRKGRWSNVKITSTLKQPEGETSS